MFLMYCSLFLVSCFLARVSVLLVSVIVSLLIIWMRLLDVCCVLFVVDRCSWFVVLLFVVRCLVFVACSL